MNRIPKIGKTLDDYMAEATAQFCRNAIRTGRWTTDTIKQWCVDRFDATGRLNKPVYLLDGIEVQKRALFIVDHFALLEFVEDRLTTMPELSRRMAGITATLAAGSHSFIVWKVYQVFNDEDIAAVFGAFISETGEERKFAAIPHTMLTGLLGILVSNSVLNYAGEWEDANT